MLIESLNSIELALSMNLSNINYLFVKIQILELIDKIEDAFRLISDLRKLENSFRVEETYSRLKNLCEDLARKL